MKTFGIIGNPLSHSFSPKYYNEKFEMLSISASYHSFLLHDISFFPALIAEHDNLFGLNVTTPFKESVIPFLDELDPIAEELQAVNTITIQKQNEKIFLKGFNTDVYGFDVSLRDFYLKKDYNTALILGSGGAAKAVAYVLKKSQIPFHFVSRKPVAENQVSYHDLNKDIIKNVNLIINTTPLGMYPDISSFPSIPYEYLTKNHYLMDLTYNPNESIFLKKGKLKKAKTKNGYQMLLEQAERSREIFSQCY